MTTASRHARPAGAAGARAVRAVGLGLLVAAAAALLLAGASGVRFLPVLTGSMTPYAPAGSLVLTVPVDGSDVTTGDVLAFRPPAPFKVAGDRPILHRIDDLGVETGRPYLVTRGDANPSADPWRVATDGADFGRAVLVIPHLGRLLAGGPTAALAFTIGARPC